MTSPEQAKEALSLVVSHLSAGPAVTAVLVREPLLDAQCPETSDLDLILFDEVDELIPERLRIDAPIPIDVIRLPQRWLDELEQLARMGLVPHRLLSSRVVYDKPGAVADRLGELRRKMYEPEIQAARLTGFLDMGFYAVREVGVTWDFPALALFWLHVGYAACLAALADGARRFCPNVYTRPLEYGRELEELCGLRIVEPCEEALRLDIDPADLIEPLRHLHSTVVERFPEPEWPVNMRQCTRYEYRYFSASEELEWRMSVAEEMARRRNCPDAVFYLRFWAYTLARLPMVYHRAQEGINVSFMRPECAVRADLEKHCPEILDDLTVILAPRRLSAAHVSLSLEMLYECREQTLTFLKSRGVEFSDLRQWQPATQVPSRFARHPLNDSPHQPNQLSLT